MNLLIKKLQVIIYAIGLVGLTSYSPNALSIEPKVKAVITMAGYGTVGGALLGAASLAFDTGGRSVAIGASVGLYIGLIFGSFIVVSHKLKAYNAENPVPKDNYYPNTDGQGPYQGGGGGGWFGGDEEQEQLWNPTISLDDLSIQTAHQKIIQWKSKARRNNPVFYMNLWNYQF